MATDKQQLKTVLITGGGSGIGLETAKLLLESKTYRVVLLGRNRAKLENAADVLGGSTELISIFTCDLRDQGQVKRTIEKINGAYKGIYGLVNNAGIYPLGGLMDTTEASWDEAMAVNLKAPYLLIQSVVETMIKTQGGGRIVNVILHGRNSP